MTNRSRKRVMSQSETFQLKKPILQLVNKTKDIVQDKTQQKISQTKKGVLMEKIKTLVGDMNGSGIKILIVIMN